MELKRLLQIAITSVTFNATDTYMEEQEEPDTVCLREGMEETEAEEGGGRSSAQLTPETETDKEVNMCIVKVLISCLGAWVRIQAFCGIWLRIQFQVFHNQSWKILRFSP
jgi:hypothetical protein